MMTGICNCMSVILEKYGMIYTLGVETTNKTK